MAGTVVAPQASSALALRPRVPTAVRILQIYAVVLFVIPSFTVFEPIGAAAFPAGLLGLGALLVWGVWVLLGHHNPLRTRTPVRVAFGAIWLTSLASYIAMQFRSRSTVEILGADRWLLFLASMTGVALLAAETIPTLDDLKRVLRAVMWGAAFCGGVAIIQYLFLYDLAPFFGQVIPGFTFNDDLGGIEFRAGLNRVPGTMLHPIELGTTAAVLFPLAVYMAMYDKSVSFRRRFVPAMLIGACIPVSVSRSAILGITASMMIFIVLLPAKQRVIGLASIPVVIGSVFLLLRGIVSTLYNYFGLGGSDPSISTRTDDYPLVEHFVRQRPWFGRGGGTYLPESVLEILDNAYLKWVIEFGFVGLAVLVIFFFAVPTATAFYARKRARLPELRVLNGALGAAMVSAAIASFTFDSLAFPVFTCVLALTIGFIGSSWRFTDVRPSWRKGPAWGDSGGC